MALVIKGNKQLTVATEKVKEYLSIGYSEIDEEGKILRVGEATDLKDIKAENADLKAKLAEYQTVSLEEIEAIKSSQEALIAESSNKDIEIDTLRKENEALKAENANLKEQLEAATKKTK